MVVEIAGMDELAAAVGAEDLRTREGFERVLAHMPRTQEGRRAKLLYVAAWLAAKKADLTPEERKLVLEH